MTRPVTQSHCATCLSRPQFISLLLQALNQMTARTCAPQAVLWCTTERQLDGNTLCLMPPEERLLGRKKWCVVSTLQYWQLASSQLPLQLFACEQAANHQNDSPQLEKRHRLVVCPAKTATERESAFATIVAKRASQSLFFVHDWARRWSLAGRKNIYILLFQETSQTGCCKAQSSTSCSDTARQEQIHIYIVLWGFMDGNTKLRYLELEDQKVIKAHMQHTGYCCLRRPEVHLLPRCCSPEENTYIYCHPGCIRRNATECNPQPPATAHQDQKHIYIVILAIALAAAQWCCGCSWHSRCKVRKS